MLIDTVVRSFGTLSPRLRLRWAALVPALAVAAGIEMASTVAVVWAAAVVTGSSVAGIGIVDRAFALTRLPRTALTAVAFVTALLLLKNGAMALAAVWRSRVLADSYSELFARTVRRILETPYAFRMQSRSSDLTAQATTSIDAVCRLVLAPAAVIVAELLTGAAVASVLLMIAPFSTFVVLVALVVVLAGSVLLMRRRLTRWGTDALEAGEGVLRIVQTLLSLASEIQLFRRQRFFRRRTMEVHEGFVAAFRRHVLALALSRALLETIFVVLAIGVLAGAAMRGGAAALPLFALTAYAGMRILPSLYRIAHFSNEILLGRSAVIQLTTDVDAPASASDEQLTSTIRNGITVENVSFTYPEARRATLQHVSLHIERGVRLGIVGASGTGKSTLLHLVAGLLEPSEGSIAFDGAPLRDVPRKIAIVPQTVVLYDASLRENVAFGIEPAAIDEEQLRRVLTIAQLNEVVAVLPDGLDTMVGERGARLSVGERQRVGVARALYADPEVLLLDEPTSALDAETEKRLIHALGTSLRGVTLLLVTHSPAALKLCDCSILVDDGAVTVTIAEHAAL